MGIIRLDEKGENSIKIVLGDEGRDAADLGIGPRIWMNLAVVKERTHGTTASRPTHCHATQF